VHSHRGLDAMHHGLRRIGRRSHQLAQASIAEQRAIDVVRIGDAVGEGNQCFTVAEHHLGRVEIHVRQHADCRSRRREACAHALRAGDEGRLVSGVDVDQFSAGKVKAAEKHRREHVGTLVGAGDVVVDVANQLARLARGVATWCQQALAQCAHQRTE